MFRSLVLGYTPFCRVCRGHVGCILQELRAATRKQAASSKVSLATALGALVCMEIFSYICEVMWAMYEGGELFCELNE